MLLVALAVHSARKRVVAEERLVDRILARVPQPGRNGRVVVAARPDRELRIEVDHIDELFYLVGVFERDHFAVADERSVRRLIKNSLLVVKY